MADTATLPVSRWISVPTAVLTTAHEQWIRQAIDDLHAKLAGQLPTDPGDYDLRAYLENVDYDSALDLARDELGPDATDDELAATVGRWLNTTILRVEAVPRG